MPRFPPCEIIFFGLKLTVPVIINRDNWHWTQYERDRNYVKVLEEKTNHWGGTFLKKPSSDLPGFKIISSGVKTLFYGCVVCGYEFHQSRSAFLLSLFFFLLTGKPRETGAPVKDEISHQFKWRNKIACTQRWKRNHNIIRKGFKTKKKHGNGIFITKKRKNKSQDGNLIPIFLKIIFV